MTIVFQGLLLNTCIAAALAAILFLVQRVRPLRHRPQLCHALWLLLLLKLFMPPLVVMNLPWPQWVKATPSFQISNEPFPQGMDPVAMDVVQMDLKASVSQPPRFLERGICIGILVLAHLQR